MGWRSQQKGHIAQTQCVRLAHLANQHDWPETAFSGVGSPVWQTDDGRWTILADEGVGTFPTPACAQAVAFSLGIAATAPGQ
jgi:hypothetical protein